MTSWRWLILLCVAACSSTTVPSAGLRGEERLSVDPGRLQLAPGRDAWITVSTFEVINANRMEPVTPDVTFSSSNPDVATVAANGQNGFVVARRVGDARITVRSRRSPENVAHIDVLVRAAPSGNETGLTYSANVAVVPNNGAPAGSLGPAEMQGEIVVTNPTAQTRSIYLAGCHWLFLYRDASYSGPPLNPIPPGVQCNVPPKLVEIAPGGAQSFPIDFRLTLQGDSLPTGRLYVQGALDRVRDLLLVRAGPVDLVSPIAGLSFSATTTAADGRLRPSVSFKNTNDKPVHLEYGACSVDLLAFRTPQRTGTPAWNSGALGYACLAYLRTGTIAPGETQSPGEYNPTFPIATMLGDSLPSGRYYFKAAVRLNWRSVSVDAGDAEVKK